MDPKDGEEKELTLNDEIRAAMTEPEEKEESPGEQRARGEDGKFIAKEGETEVEAAARLEPAAKDKPIQDKPEPQPVEEGERVLTEDKAPRGWGPAAREKWATIPEDLRQEILRREEASVVGVRQLQERFAPMEGFVQQISPVFAEAQAVGASPAQYIHALANTERLLRTADVPAKFQELLRLADQYGVPLREVINESVGAQILPRAGAQQPQALPPAVQQELEEMRQWRKQFEGDNINNEIARFSKDKEFFDDVRIKMAVFVDSGEAKTLEEAYDAACWATPEVRKVLMSRQGKSQQEEELKNKQQTASGASVKNSGVVDVKVDNEDDDDLAATIRKEYARSSNGRV